MSKNLIINLVIWISLLSFGAAAFAQTLAQYGESDDAIQCRQEKSFSSGKRRATSLKPLPLCAPRRPTYIGSYARRPQHVKCKKNSEFVMKSR